MDEDNVIEFSTEVFFLEAMDEDTVIEFSTEEIFLERTRPVSTVIPTGQIFLERTRRVGQMALQRRVEDKLAKMALGNSVIICRACGMKGDHWTAKCPDLKGFLEDENSIKVTNLSEDTQEQDLHELFRPFGPISRIYIALNRDTRQSLGFAFINYVNREDAERAIKKLDGYGYNNLMLQVDWATPRGDRG